MKRETLRRLSSLEEPSSPSSGPPLVWHEVIDPSGEIERAPSPPGWEEAESRLRLVHEVIDPPRVPNGLSP
jgi:hypothetical protein